MNTKYELAIDVDPLHIMTDKAFYHSVELEETLVFGVMSSFIKEEMPKTSYVKGSHKVVVALVVRQDDEVLTIYERDFIINLAGVHPREFSIAFATAIKTNSYLKIFD